MIPKSSPKYRSAIPDLYYPQYQSRFTRRRRGNPNPIRANPHEAVKDFVRYNVGNRRPPDLRCRVPLASTLINALVCEAWPQVAVVARLPGHERSAGAVA
jgi:hypothetical protein